MRTSLLLAACLALATITAGHAQTLDKAKLDEFFDRLAEKNKAMGSVLVAKDGVEVYARAIGYGQIAGDTKKPLTPASRFRIGSITKMFTAAMTFQLVEEGKLKLTDPLDQFLPQVPNANKITVAQILSHRSGIPNVRRERDPAAAANAPAPNTLPMTKEEHLAMIVKANPDFEPDTKTSYSNSGFIVMGLIIEKLTGKSYAAALEERITAKLGLKDTYVTASPIDVSKHEALTFFDLGSGWKQSPETHPTILYSAGAIVSTPADLAKFVRTLFDGKLVSPAALDRMKTMREGEGFGMTSFTFAEKTFYGHTGGADNYGAWLAYEPTEKLAVAYTSNAKAYPVENIVRGTIEIYYNKPFQIPALGSIAVSPDVLDRYVGAYSHPDAPAKARIARDGSTLFFYPPGAPNGAPLEATSEDKFQIEGLMTITFDIAKGQMTVKRRQGERVFTKDK